MSHNRRALAVLLASAAVTTTASARAEGSETDRQIAQSLFDDGRSLMEAGQYAAACPKFADSQRLDPGGGTLLNLALCHELEGKTATAWTEFREALSIATRDNRSDRQELASLHIAALRPKLMRVRIALPEGLAAREPEVTLDRSRVPSAAWNTAIPVDPGTHHVAVSTPGLAPWETSLAATEPGRTYRVDVPALDRPGGVAVTAVIAPDAADPRGRSTAFWLVMGGAGVAVTTSIITGLMALEANTEAKDNCSSERDFCRTLEGQEAASRATTLAWVSTSTLAAGAAAAVLAFVLPLEAKAPLTASFGVQGGAALATLRYTPSFF